MDIMKGMHDNDDDLLTGVMFECAGVFNCNCIAM
jgi:hypothetical protein